MAELISAAILIVFVALLLVAAVSTGARAVRYRRDGLEPPRLLPRDRDLIVGLALPFLLISLARVFEWDIRDEAGRTAIGWQLITGIPALYGVGRYVYFELFVIEQ